MKLTIADSEVRVELTPLEQLMGLRGSFSVPLSHVVAAQVIPANEAKSGRGFRSPGTYLPGRLTFGTWRTRHGKQFWAVRRAEKVLVVDLHDEPFDRLILEVPDADEAVEQLYSPAGNA